MLVKVVLCLIWTIICLGAESYADGKNWRVELEWSRINFTWPNAKALNRALSTKSYIAQNVVMAGIKIHNYRMYIALPRIRAGSPVTLAYVDYGQDLTTNPRLVPYPNWQMNTLEGDDCSKLINVQSMEIDSNGIMWIVDGMRINSELPDCPAKLVLVDLSDDKIISTYNFGKDISAMNGGFLNDIVVDNTDGDYAYMTETSSADPGLIVYSRKLNKAWKLRDSSMFAEKSAAQIRTGGWTQREPVNVDGIALSPLKNNKHGRGAERFVYYSALTSFSLYRISTNVLKDQELSSGNSWRQQVTLVGNKTDDSDGMIMDNKGHLYYGLLNKDGIGMWQSEDNIRDSSDFYPDTSNTNIDGMIWAHSFAMDSKGNLFVLANGIHKYFSKDYNIPNNDAIKFRVFKYRTGSKSDEGIRQDEQGHLFQQQWVTLTASMWPTDAPRGWRVSSDRLPILAAVFCGVALVVCILIALLIYRCCIMPRREKHYCLRKGEGSSQLPPNGTTPVYPSQSAVYVEPKRGEWGYTNRIIVANPNTNQGHWFYNSRVIGSGAVQCTQCPNICPAVPRSSSHPGSAAGNYEPTHHIQTINNESIHRRQRPNSQPIRFTACDLTSSNGEIPRQMQLPEISEFSPQSAQYASSSILDEVGTKDDQEASGSTLKTRSLPAWVRSKPRPLSTEDDLAELYAKVNFSKKRKNRMRNDEAAIIALSKSRSQFLHKDTDSLVDNEAVIVYDERTAL